MGRKWREENGNKIVADKKNMERKQEENGKKIVINKFVTLTGK